MKLLSIITILVSLAGFSQENPWKNKNEENPWGNDPSSEKTKETEEKPMEDIILVDTTEQKRVNEIITEIETTDSATIATNKLVQQAEIETKNNYKSGRDFAVGFASGLILNGYGTVIDLVYTIPTTKKETEAMDKVKTDSTYINIEDKRLNDRTKRAVKSKKFLSSLAGTIAGSVTQYFIVIGISIYN